VRGLACALLAAAAVAGAGTPVVEVPPLRVGTSGDYAPFSIVRDGEHDGLDVEIARRFARDLGRRLELVPFRWPELERDLAAGRFDVAMSGVTVRPERALVGTFTRPLLETGTVVLARGDPPPTLASLDRPGARLAVNAGGHLERVARRLFPHASIVAGDNAALPELVAAGSADAVVTDDVEADLFATRLPGARRLGPLTRDRKAHLGRDPAVLGRLDRWLRDREADGTLARLRGRWLGPARAAPRSAFASDLDALAALLDLRLALMPAVAAAKEARGLPIEDPAQEARVLAAARRQALDHRLDPAGVERLFRALIAAGRAVQTGFLATPRAARPPVPGVDLEREARPALAAISAGIVARAADLARPPGSLARADPETLAARLDATLTPAARRLAIARAVVALGRADAPARAP
jgi:cyclohexadienyl dehydratase